LWVLGDKRREKSGGGERVKMVDNKQMSLTLLKAVGEFDSKINECAEVFPQKTLAAPGSSAAALCVLRLWADLGL